MAEYCMGNDVFTGYMSWSANFIAALRSYTWLYPNCVFSRVRVFCSPNGVQRIKCAIYRASDLSFAAETDEVVQPGLGAQWYDFPAVGAVDLEGIGYRACVWSDQALTLYRRVLTAGMGYMSRPYDSWPPTLTLTSYNYEPCIQYCGVEKPKAARRVFGDGLVSMVYCVPLAAALRRTTTTKLSLSPLCFL